MPVSILVTSFIAEDFLALTEFYQRTFELPEVTDLRSDIFRGLDVQGVILGFHAPAAYDLLHISDFQPARGAKSLLLFEVASDEEVSDRSATAVRNGARLLHEPYLTYYDAFQTVLADPEDNLFRINHFHRPPLTCD
jgi:hypothetical protein